MALRLPCHHPPASLVGGSQLPPRLLAAQPENSAQKMQSPTPHQPETCSLGLTLPKSLAALSAEKEPGIFQGQQHPCLHFSRTPL